MYMHELIVRRMSPHMHFFDPKKAIPSMVDPDISVIEAKPRAWCFRAFHH